MGKLIAKRNKTAVSCLGRDILPKEKVVELLKNAQVHLTFPLVLWRCLHKNP